MAAEANVHRFNRPIIVETPRCILSEMCVRDSAFWHRFLNNPKVNRYLSERFESQDRLEEAINWLVSNYDKSPPKATRITLSVSLKDNADAPIGWVTSGPLPEENSLKEVGYALSPEHWGKGIATEVAGRFVEWLQETYPHSNLYATVDIRNLASIRVLNKIGMRKYPTDSQKPIVPANGHEIYWLRGQ